MYPIKTVQKTNAMLSKPVRQQAHLRPTSTTTVSTCHSCSQEIFSPPPSPWPSQLRHSSSSSTRRTRHPPQTPPAQDVNDDLNNLIDEHIAWTQGTAVRQRRESQGTMIVDWDGTGAPIVSWRGNGVALEDNDEEASSTLNSKPLPPIPSTPTSPFPPSHYTTILSRARNPPQQQTQTQRPNSPLVPPSPSFTALYHPPRYSPTTQTHHLPYIAGYDASTHFSYDYDGRIVHVHRRGGQQQQGQHDEANARLSTHSDYYAMDLDKYSRGVEVRVAESEGAASKGKKQGSVAKFVEKILVRLEGMGVLGRLREDRKKLAVTSKAKGKGKKKKKCGM